MTEEFIEVADGFWNIRGSFKIGGLVDIKTHASLVRLANGNFVFLDSYTLSWKGRQRVAEIVGENSEVEAILNLHPFHTVHVEKMHKMYPRARLYGTARHLQRFGDLPWQAECTETRQLHELYAQDLEFSVPAGVDFISTNENVHFSSVLVRHPRSGTLHVDDTLMLLKMPRFIGYFRDSGVLGFHPTLSKALQRRPGAAAEFRAWATWLIEEWGSADNLCAAHSATLLGRRARDPSFRKQLVRALAKCERRLVKHKRLYG